MIKFKQINFHSTWHTYLHRMHNNIHLNNCVQWFLSHVWHQTSIRQRPSLRSRLSLFPKFCCNCFSNISSRHNRSSSASSLSFQVTIGSSWNIFMWVLPNTKFSCLLFLLYLCFFFILFCRLLSYLLSSLLLVSPLQLFIFL